MTRWFVALLLCATVAVSLAASVADIRDTCASLAAEVKAKGVKRWVGEWRHFCAPTIETAREAYCNCKVVPRDVIDQHKAFIEKVSEAKSFLNGRTSTTAENLYQECCIEGCYWEEVQEHC